MLSVGIIGLPNVGKSTLFNALTEVEANISNYPFTTIDSNVGVVPVPDPELKKLNEVLRPQECTPSFVQFIDIAGLVKGASQGEGLGNQFLGNIRDVDAIAHLVRCFQDSDVSHVLGSVDPGRDIEIIETELLLADLVVLSSAIEKQERIWKTKPKKYTGEKKQWESYREALEAGTPLRTLPLSKDDHRELKALGMLTAKPVIYVLNLSEDEISQLPPPCLDKLQEIPLFQRDSDLSEVVTVSAQLESEIQQLEVTEKEVFMKDLEMPRSGLESLIQQAFRILGLITFYTVVNEKLRAWEIPQGTKAPQAAGKIHSEMEEGFIRAQVVSWNDLVQYGDLKEMMLQGRVRTEGKDYEVQNRDVIQFMFK